MSIMTTPLREIKDHVISVTEMQRHIMPDPQRLRSFPGYDMYGDTVPVDFVGGDFFDLVDLKRFGIRDRMAVVIADASGHGLSAAMLVRDFNTALFTGIAFESHYAGDTTGLLFHKINRRMFRSSLKNQFISAFYGELQADGRLRYINAGHPPPFIFRENGSFESLETGGMVLGAFREPPTEYAVGETYLSSDDLVIAYTDGILEAADHSGEEYGAFRLRGGIAANPKGSAREVFERVIADVSDFTEGSPQADDETLVVIRRTGE